MMKSETNGRRRFGNENKLYNGKDDNEVEMVVKKTKGNSVTSVSKNEHKINNILSWSRGFQLYAIIY